MKKKSKLRIIIIVVVVVVVLVCAIVGVNVGLMLRETSKMNPLDTGEVIPGIYAVKDSYVNLYLLQLPDGKYIAIDAGTNASTVKDELSSLGISGSDVVAVLMTHTHGDHTGALDVFDKAEIYGSANSNYGKVSNKLADDEITEIAGVTVQCIFTPGHYSDSVCYLIDGKYLFTGDTLSLKDNKVGLFNSAFNTSDEQQEKDIKRLSGISGVQYIFTAHYGFTNSAVFP